MYIAADLLLSSRVSIDTGKIKDSTAVSKEEVVNMVGKMRCFRDGMVQTQEQFDCIGQSVKDAIDIIQSGGLS